MSGTAQLQRTTTLPQSAEHQALIELNRAVTDLETLRARLYLLHMNRCSSNAGIAIATTTTKVKYANTVTYAVDGAIYTQTATDNFWTLSGTLVAVSSWQKYLLYIDSAGAASIAEGTQSTVSAAGVVLPTPASAKCIVGVLTIATDASHTFTPGTTALGAAGITATYTNGIDPSLFTAASGLTAAQVKDLSGTVIAT